MERAADLSRAELTRYVVRYQPLYSIQQVSQLTGINTTKLGRALSLGHIPYFMDGKREMVTGWAVIAYIEALEAGVLTIPPFRGDP